MQPLLLVWILLLGGLAAPQAAAQTPDRVPVYHRETFDYPHQGRHDPFRSLLDSENLAYRVEGLQLTGVVYQPDAPQASVAVLHVAAGDRQLRVRVGTRLGSIRVTRIQPESIDLLVDELGTVRRETLRLVRERDEPSR